MYMSEELYYIDNSFHIEPASYLFKLHRKYIVNFLKIIAMKSRLNI